MKHFTTGLIRASALIFTLSYAAIAEPPATTSQTPRFKYTDLGVSTDANGSIAVINNHNQILITTDNGKTTPQSILISGNQRIDFSKAVGIDQFKCNFVAIKINDSGVVLGGGYGIVNSKMQEFEFLYQHGQAEEIVPITPVAREDDNTTFEDINIQGQLIGETTLFNRDTRDHPHGFLYEHGEMVDLSPFTQVTAINDKGQVVGLTHDQSSGLAAAIYTNGNITILPPFQTVSSGKGALALDSVMPIHINNKGWVTGFERVAVDPHTEESISHAIFYHDGKTIDLGTLGGERSGGNCINDAGQIVGTADTKGVKESINAHAFLYQNGRMLDLNKLTGVPLGWLLTEATSINNRGVIVGKVKNLRTRMFHVFLLTPTNKITAAILP